MSTTIDDLGVSAQPILTGAMSKFRYSKKLAEKFTGMSRFDEPYTMYVEKDEFIYIPRQVCPIGEKDTRTVGFTFKADMKFQPRDDKQRRIIGEALPLLQKDENFIIRAATGVGKTFCAINLMVQMGRSALIVVPKDDLMEQWYKEILRYTTIPASRIGFIKQDTCDYQGKWVVIAILHSIAKPDRYPADMYRQFGLFIADECHRLAAETFSQVCCLVPAKLRLGLSATPERQDGKEALIEAHMGSVKVIEDGDPMTFKVLQYRSTWECPRREVRIGNHIEYRRIEHTAGKCGHITNMIARHPPDQLKIAEWAKKAYEKDRYTIVFSDRIEHLKELMEQCRIAGVPQRDMEYYVGSREVDGKMKAMTRAEKEAAKSKRILFCTYGAAKEGTDIPWFDTIIFATPRSDVKQAVGRILREYEGKAPPVVFEILHDDSPVFLGYAKKRATYYADKKAPVKVIS